MTQNNNLKTQSKLETQSSKYELIKKIPFKTIIGTGIIVSISIVFYKNYDKFIIFYNNVCDFYDRICYYCNIFKKLLFFKIGLNLTNKSIKTVTEINYYKNKFICLSTLNKVKTTKDIINIVFRRGIKLIKK